MIRVPELRVRHPREGEIGRVAARAGDLLLAVLPHEPRRGGLDRRHRNLSFVCGRILGEAARSRFPLQGRAVPGGGVEPPSRAPKARVLPLDHPGPPPIIADGRGRGRHHPMDAQRGPATTRDEGHRLAKDPAWPWSRASPATDDPLPLITAPSAPASSSAALASAKSG